MHNDYNFALIPGDSAFADICIDLAQANLKKIARDYLLGDNALPHVTLCQFRCEPQKLNAIWSSVSDLHNFSMQLQFDFFYIKRGKNEHSNFHWVGLSVRSTPELSKLQRDVYDILHNAGLETRTDPNKYLPHITFGGCPLPEPIVISSVPPAEFWQTKHDFQFSLGESTPIGVYRKCLYQ